EPRLGDPGPLAVDEGELPDGNDHRLLVYELLDLLQDRLALLSVLFARLLAKESVDVRVAAVHVGAASDDEGFQSLSRVAEGAVRRVRAILEFLLPEAVVERRALQRPERRADTDGPEVVDDGLLHVGVRDVAVVLAGVEAVRIARLRQELLRARRVERI